LTERGVPVHALHVRSLTDMDTQLGELATVLGATWEPIAATPLPVRMRAAVLIWRRPWMALGAPTYGSSLLEALGISNVFAADGPYPEITLEDAATRRPDILIAPSEPYPFGERHRHELTAVAPPVFVDGRDLLWWGARTRGALARLNRVGSR
jgi:hypothetical protein